MRRRSEQARRRLSFSAACARILFRMLRVRSLGDRKQRRSPRQETQGDLARRGIMPVGDLFQHPPSRAVGLRKSASVTKRAIGDHGDAVVLAPRDHRMLDRPLTQMVEHLIAGWMACPRNPLDFVEIVHIEIADAPRQDLSVGAKPLEGGDRILKRVRARASGEDSNRGGRS